MLHVDVQDSFNVIVFVRDGVVVTVIVILLHFAFEGNICRKEFADVLTYPGQTFFLVCGISFPEEFTRCL